jgi:HSP20 family protein
MESDARRNQDEVPVREKQAVTRDPGTHEGPYFEPPVDIYETPDAITLSADLPGVKVDAIQTDLRNNLLTITARVEPVDSRWKPLHREYAIGNYVREFRIGQQIDQSKISAQFKDGVLTLILPKADSAKPRRIQIQTA